MDTTPLQGPPTIHLRLLAKDENETSEEKRDLMGLQACTPEDPTYLSSGNSRLAPKVWRRFVDDRERGLYRYCLAYVLCESGGEEAGEVELCKSETGPSGSFGGRRWAQCGLCVAAINATSARSQVREFRLRCLGLGVRG